MSVFLGVAAPIYFVYRSQATRTFRELITVPEAIPTEEGALMGDRMISC